MPTYTPRGFPLYSDGEAFPGWGAAFNSQSNLLDTAMDTSDAALQAAWSVDTIADIPDPGDSVRGQVLFCDEDDLLYVFDGTGWYAFGGKKPYFFGSRTYSALSAGSVRQPFVTTSDYARGTSLSSGEITFETVGIYHIHMSVVWEANIFGQRNLGIDGTDFTVLGSAVNYMFPDSLIQVTQAYSSHILVTAPGAVARPYVDQNSLSALSMEGNVSAMWVSA
jgi:hypothetical protein